MNFHHLGMIAFLAIGVAVPSLSADDEAADEAIQQAVSLFELLVDVDADSAGECLKIIAEKTQTGEIQGPRLKTLGEQLDGSFAPILAKGPTHPLFADVALVAASWRNPSALAAARKMLTAGDSSLSTRERALAALVAAAEPKLLETAAAIFADRERNSADFRAATLAAIGRWNEPRVADVILQNYAKFEAELQPKAIEVLTQRSSWSRKLLTAIGEGKVPKNALNVNQVRQLLASRDDQLAALVTKHWGAVRSERNPQREQVIQEMRVLLEQTPGDTGRGQIVFHKVCGQCHKIFGKGHDVGPDITSNGRNSFDQLLSNVFDPSLVIGAAYQARTVITDDGRVLTGLLAEDNPQRIVLKLQGGKQEIVPRDQIEEMQISRLSLMPEGLEKQLKPQEIADLFAFLMLSEPPEGTP